MTNKPVLHDKRWSNGTRSVTLENVCASQGVSAYALHHPDRVPPGGSGSGALGLGELEAREIHRRLGEIIGEWDASAVRAFSAKRSQYSVEHVITIARECGLSGIPFCSECADWHTPDEDHSLDEE